ncbi:MAG: hypothetical protein CBC13_03395 [Planctomycetia bacterium TMED53]|nr:MAG: hypothetical protein CBC13_03395 [Planctomycetia bacterium TMED53]
MNPAVQKPESGATLLEILMASVVFIVVLALSLGAASEFSAYGNQADADAGIQLDCHRAFSRMESVLRQGWSTPEISTDGTSVDIQILGYFFNTGSQSWERIDPATWQRQYDPSTASYYFEDSSGFELPVADCTVSWVRKSNDPASEQYHFGDLTCTISSGSNSTSWVLAPDIGTFETDSGGQRHNGIEFSLNGRSIEVKLKLQRSVDEVPYGMRSRIQQRNYLDGI